MSPNKSFINFRIAILAFVMVAWGVAEFALHTLRPNTIQRENRIVQVFKESSDIIWNTHKDLQIRTASLSNGIQNESRQIGSDGTINIDQSDFPSDTDWLLVKNGTTLWWSDMLSLDVVNAMIQATSVLYSSENGVYVIASSNWTQGTDSWQLLGSRKIFEIAIEGSRFGDVYQPVNPQLINLQPTPFYLEGSPDLLPFDHRFSIIRVNENYTTGHLALSTLDPDVRNYFNPVWMFGFRTIFLILVSFLCWRILTLFIEEYQTLSKTLFKIVFITFWGFTAVLLDVIKFWSGTVSTGSLNLTDSMPVYLVYMAWASVVLLIVFRLLINYFRTERFFDHGTRFNRTSLILFLTGCSFGGFYWWIMIFHSSLMQHGSYFALNPGFSSPTEILIALSWFILISAIYKLVEGILHFIQKSVKYQLQWIHQVLIAGHLYMFTILFIVNYSSGTLNYSKSALILLMLPFAMWIIQQNFNTVEKNGETSLFRQALKLSIYPVLVASLLYGTEYYDNLLVNELIGVIVGYWILSILASLIVIGCIYSFTENSAPPVTINFRSYFDPKSDLRQIVASTFIVIIYFSTSIVADQITRSRLEQQYANFQFNQSNHHPVAGSYEPEILQLPVFKQWTVTDQPHFESMLDYSILRSTLQSSGTNTINWITEPENSTKILQIFRADEGDRNQENYRILATTVDVYSRIFSRQSAIISSLSILAVLSIHFGLGIVGRRSTITNATPTEES